MITDHTLTPEQAREQLATSRPRSLRSERDRNVHAIGTAVFGLSLGLLMAPWNLLSGTAELLLSATFLAVWAAAAIWVERRARTVPRRSRRWSRLGLGVSLALALVAVVPWLNLQAQTEPNTWPMALGAALVIAAPSLLAAAVIAGGRR
jgi:cytochrome bd-type quinol oxidase subunit 2